ncbi:MAG: TrmH family RNA methyltransferase [Pelagibacteraceae bacterium]
MKNFMILGKYPVIEAIKSKSERLLKVYILGQNTKYLQNLNYSNFEIVDKKFFKKIYKNQDIVHQGYAAKVSQNSLDIKELSRTNNNIVLLDNINDPRNQGAIIRSCLAFNVYDIIIEKKFFKENNLSMHIASSGATMKTRIYEVSNLNNIIKVLKNNNFFIYGFDNDGAYSIDNYDFNKNKNVFIFGSEGSGLRNNISDKCDAILKININEDIDSLNVSNASAIALHELHKKNRP